MAALQSPSARFARVLRGALGFSLFAVGCSSGHLSVGDNRSVQDAATPDAMPPDAASGGAGGETNQEPSASTLLPLLAACTTQVSQGLLAPRSGHAADVPVCALSNALFWKSELAVDCDGKQTTTCNSKKDPQYQNSTVGKDSAGNSLDASVVAYVEVPVKNAVFDYAAAGLSMGSVVAVIYNGQLAYGVVGHEQDAGQIGAGSVALATRLGIDPNPVTGGLEAEVVSYIAFTGAGNVVGALEDDAATTALAKTAAQALLKTGH